MKEFSTFHCFFHNLQNRKSSGTFRRKSNIEKQKIVSSFIPFLTTGLSAFLTRSWLPKGTRLNAEILTCTVNFTRGLICTSCSSSLASLAVWP